MKRTIIYISTFFTFLLLVSPVANAQSLIAGEYTVNSVRYKVEVPTEHSSIFIKRTPLPSLPERAETVKGIAFYYIHTQLTNEAVWCQIILNTLGSQRVAALKKNRDQLRVNFYFKPSGEIHYVYLTVRKHSIFTLQEIAKIEQDLLKKYKAKLESQYNLHEGLSWIKMTGELDFSEL